MRISTAQLKKLAMDGKATDSDGNPVRMRDYITEPKEVKPNNTDLIKELTKSIAVVLSEHKPTLNTTDSANIIAAAIKELIGAMPKTSNKDIVAAISLAANQVLKEIKPYKKRYEIEVDRDNMGLATKYIVKEV